MLVEKNVESMDSQDMHGDRWLNELQRQGQQWQEERASLLSRIQEMQHFRQEEGSATELKQELLAFQSQAQNYYLLFRRAESFRKALAYQKRYLILLLGGFQDCEDVTLALIARIGTPTLDADGNIMRAGQPTRPSPLARFRRAALVLVACHRLRTLQRRWAAARRGERGGVAAGVHGSFTLTQTATHRQQSSSARTSSSSRRQEEAREVYAAPETARWQRDILAQVDAGLRLPGQRAGSSSTVRS
jgi:hypothetical protein